MPKLGTVAFTLLAACVAPEAIAAPTQVNVRLDVTDAQLKVRLTELRVSASVYVGGGWRRPVMQTIGTSDVAWPIDVPVHPRNAADASKSFEVVIEAFQDSQRLLQQRVVTTFVAGRHFVLPVGLFSCPGHEPNFVCAPDDCQGQQCEACTAAGACEPVGLLDPTMLVSVSPSAAIDSGVGSDGALSSEDATGAIADASGHRVGIEAGDDAMVVSNPSGMDGAVSMGGDGTSSPVDAGPSPCIATGEDSGIAPGTNLCVQCTQERDCAASGRHCQTAAISPNVNTCVQCLQDSDCVAGTHCLMATGQCVGCLNASHCAGRATASVCDATTHLCTNCRDGMDADCNNVPGLNICQAGTCVQCLVTKRAACAEAQPSCSASYKCDVCKADSDCERFGSACDEISGKCVACTLDTESARCGSTSCATATHACTQTSRGSVGPCGRCTADSECTASYRCVEVMFGSSSQGGHCLRPVTAVCESPLRFVVSERTSLSGAARERYCGFSEDRTTCEAVLKFGSSCAAQRDDTCAPAGAVCRNIAGWVCSYPCDTNLDCPAGTMCPTAGTDKFCRP